MRPLFCLRWARRRAALVLVWESLWTAALPLIGVLFLFFSVAWMGGFGSLPLWLHWLLLLVFAGTGAYLLWRGWRRFFWPDSETIDRRIESASKLSHRPLKVLSDRPAGGGDALALSLWNLHTTQILAALTRLRVGFPGRGALEADPYGLRALAVCGLILGGVVAGPQRLDRLYAALTPPLPAASDAPRSIEIWATPPAYTQQPPIALTRMPDAGRLDLPGGSRLQVHLSGYSRAPVVVAPGKMELALTRQEENRWQGEAVFPVPPQAALMGDLSVGNRRWPLRLLPDKLPEIRFQAPPSPSPRQALRLSWAGEDDYGVETVALEVRLAEREGAVWALPLASPARKTARGLAVPDLTDHPWAGLRVSLTLVARDGLGQEGRSAPMSLTLPARVFSNPVAREVLNLRRTLADKPGSAPEVAWALGRLAFFPEEFNHDMAIFLNLITLRERLVLEKGQGEHPQILEILWDVAVRLEEGGVGDLERDLYEAMQGALDGLAQALPDSDLSARFAAVQQALDRYLQAFARRALEAARKSDRPRRSMDPQARILSNKDIQQRMDKARELARQGQFAQARAQLDQLRDLVEQFANSEPSLADDDASGAAEGDSVSQALQALQDLARQQRTLMDLGLQKTAIGEQEPLHGELTAMQEALLRRLEEVIEPLADAAGEVPQGLGETKQAMHGALARLRQGAPSEAADWQLKAVERLRGALRMLAAQRYPSAGQAPERTGKGGAAQHDPFGRNRDAFRGDRLPGHQLDGETQGQIPEDSAVERARVIFDEIRRRAAEPKRSSIERDYLNRLLQGF